MKPENECGMRNWMEEFKKGDNNTDGTKEIKGEMKLMRYYPSALYGDPHWATL